MAACRIVSLLRRATNCHRNLHQIAKIISIRVISAIITVLIAPRPIETEEQQEISFANKRTRFGGRAVWAVISDTSISFSWKVIEPDRNVILVSSVLLV
jgi:hypothetical protein